MDYIEHIATMHHIADLFEDSGISHVRYFCPCKESRFWQAYKCI